MGNSDSYSQRTDDIEMIEQSITTMVYRHGRQEPQLSKVSKFGVFHTISNSQNQKYIMFKKSLLLIKPKSPCATTLELNQPPAEYKVIPKNTNYSQPLAK